LPVPASATTATICPGPLIASSNARRIWSSSLSRPTNLVTSLISTEERSRELKVRLRDIIDVWQSSLREMPTLKSASPKELPERIKELSLNVRNDQSDMRGFYANHRHADFPPPELLDDGWAFFRWIQVQLLAGLEFISRYGVDAKLDEESMLHELLDLDYLVSALLVGGLACREARFLERFRFLRSDGVMLR
jgi:hypothetical protein